MFALREGPQRYTRLHRAVALTSTDVVHSRTLTDTLTYLQDEELVERHQELRVADYRLTPAGTELVDLLAEIGRWDKQHRADDE